MIDVAPTLLDYLDVLIPAWMEGTSLLTDESPGYAPAYIISDVNQVNAVVGNSTVKSLSDLGPPFYGIKSMALRVCSRWFELELNSRRLSSGSVPNSDQHCAGVAVPTEAEAQGMIIEHLLERGIGRGTGLEPPEQRVAAK